LMSAALSGSSAAGEPARRGPRGWPPVRGFWSLTLYDEHHFFHPAELNRYSFGTKNKNLHRAGDGSLTLTASASRPRTRSRGPTGCPPAPGRFPCS
jgi:hypothetical protein